MMIALTFRTSTSRHATARAVQAHISISLGWEEAEDLLESLTEVGRLLEVRQLLHVRQPCDPTTTLAPNEPW